MKKQAASWMQERALSLWKATLHSYSQIFFAKNHTMGLLVMLVSFMDLQTGLGGLAGVVLANSMAGLLGFHRQSLEDGLLGINSLFVSMALAANFEMNGQMVLILALGSTFAVLATVSVAAWLGKYNLPALSLPFMLSIWTLFMAIRSLKAIESAGDDPFLINRLYDVGGKVLVNLYGLVKENAIPEVVTTYLKSLGAIIFQGNIIAGAAIAIAILIRSRITFSISVIGYGTGYLFYSWMGGNVGEFHYQAIGFNFILTAIALGGFFFVPTSRTYLMLVVVTPLIGLAVGAANLFLKTWELPTYSFPYACMVILILHVSQSSFRREWFPLVVIQRYSAERNLYSFLNYRNRFRNNAWFQIALPFFGDWKVTQAYDGEHTHRGDYRHALDFTVCDAKGMSYAPPGTELAHYLSYGLPVQAPADGYVVAVENQVDDNPIGQPNVRQNWGNSIVIQHGDQFYSQVSHLKKGSVTVGVGEHVRKGQVIAKLGNSGRSPEPHLHFQLQATPFIGSKTLPYPVAHYLRKSSEGIQYFAYDYPSEGETVCNISTTELLVTAFRFIPGQRLRWMVETGGKKPETVEWEVCTNSLNKSYLLCHSTGAVAWLENDGAQHYFSEFEGNKGTLLHCFYLGAYKVLLGYYKGLELNDVFPAHQIEGGLQMWVQDLLAPFVLFRGTEFTLRYAAPLDALQPRALRLDSTVIRRIFRKETRLAAFSMDLTSGSIQRFEGEFKGRKFTATRMEEEVLDYSDN